MAPRKSTSSKDAASLAPKKKKSQSDQRGSNGNLRPWKKGQSGNPGGRPKEAAEIKELARQHTLEAIEKLVEWMRTDNPKASVSACNVLLDRGWGKAPQAITGEDGGPAKIIMQIVTGVPREDN